MPSSIPLISLLCGALWLCSCSPRSEPGTEPGQEPGSTNKSAAGQQPAIKNGQTKPEKPKTPRPKTPTPKLEPDQESPKDLLTYPRDKSKVVARVNGRDITLEQVLKHIDQRHFQGYRSFLSTRFGQVELRTAIISGFIRQYADYTALNTEARARRIDRAQILSRQKAAYRARYAAYCQNYTKRTGNPAPTSGPTLESFVEIFQKRNGLSLEIEGLLTAMAGGEVGQEEADKFYRDHAQHFNGLIDIAQIFIRNRDRATGALYTGSRAQATKERVKLIRSKIRSDGSNFEDIAAQYSHSERSRALGGKLQNLLRFDPRMPASLCRAAWYLKRGEWTGPIETQYGLHFVKRGIYRQRSMILRLDAKNPDVQRFIRRHKEEDLMFQVREKANVELLY